MVHLTSYSKSVISENCREVSIDEFTDSKNLSRGSWIPRGAGNAYSAAAQVRNGIAVTSLNSTIYWTNPEKTLLKVSGGVSMGKLLDYCLSQGRSLYVVPGSGKVTLGGAIAFDVHGKNHSSSGTFGEYVREIVLQTSKDSIIVCSPSKNPQIFASTIGGMGLTGLILEAIIEVSNLTFRKFESNEYYFDNFESLLDAMRKNSRKYQIGWIDLTRRNEFRSILSVSSPIFTETIERLPKRREIKLLPRLNLFNKLSIAIFNNLKIAGFRMRKSATKNISFDKVLFPLDRLGKWNNFFGKYGLIEFQFVFPRSKSNEALTVIRAINRLSPGALIAVKLFGHRKSAGVMSFPLEGFCIGVTTHAKNLSSEKLREFTEQVTLLEGRCYLAKNNSFTRETLIRQYPEFTNLLLAKQSIDPKGLISSDLLEEING